MLDLLCRFVLNFKLELPVHTTLAANKFVANIGENIRMATIKVIFLIYK